jgi:zeaxanthin glucosyltransferase
MNQSTIIFLFSPYYGHLIKSLMLAKFYAAKGYSIHYFVYKEATAFEAIAGFPVTTTSSKPFGVGLEGLDDEGQKRSWKENMKERIAGTLFNDRKQELDKLVQELNPTYIFLDEFCASDFIILYPHRHKCVMLVPTLPNYPNPAIPPLNTFAFPNEQVKKYWTKQAFQGFFKNIEQKITFLGFDNESLLKRRFNQQKIAQTYRYSFLNNKYPCFAGVARWYMLPQEFDFPSRSLPSIDRYIGPVVTLNRAEKTTLIYSLFMKLAGASPDNKIIYCAFGTVIQNYFSDEELVAFYQKLVRIALEKPTWYFLVAVPPAVLKKLKVNSLNIIFTDFVPQLDALSRATVFITHGGGSILESIYKATPMLVLPPAAKFDYIGNSARVVYHGLGLNGKVHDTDEVLMGQLQELIANPRYTLAVQQMSELFKTKYHRDYLNDLALPT